MAENKQQEESNSPTPIIAGSVFTIEEAVDPSSTFVVATNETAMEPANGELPNSVDVPIDDSLSASGSESVQVVDAFTPVQVEAPRQSNTLGLECRLRFSNCFLFLR